MSGDSQKKSKPLRASPGYDVGYGKPPEAGRFKPGQSGNSSGRPRGSKNKQPALHEEPFKQLFMKEANREIKVHDGNQDITMPVAQAAMRSLFVKAAKGDHRSQSLVAKMISLVEAEAKAQNREWLEVIIGLKVDGERELERRKRLGIEGPDLIPHPDDIHIDFANNTATAIQPITKQEKEHLESVRKMKSEYGDKLVEFEAELKVQKTEVARAEIEDKIRAFRRVVKKIDKALGLD